MGHDRAAASDRDASGRGLPDEVGGIDRSTAVWVYTPRKHKTEHYGHHRSVYLDPRSQQILQPWLKDNPDAYLFSPREAEKERRAKQRAERKTKVQPSPKNRKKPNPRRTPRDCYDTASYYRAVYRGCELANVKKWHPNQLRHTAATEIHKRFGVEAVSILLVTARSE